MRLIKALLIFWRDSERRERLNMANKGVNKVIIIGNLGKDPEVRFMPDARAVCNFSIATSESWKDKQTGEKKEITEWHRICIFGKLAEIAGEYLKKGSKVYIEGKLQTRKWQGQDGQDRYTTEIVARDMQMLDSRSTSTSGQNTAEQYQAAKNGEFEDDIPF